MKKQCVNTEKGREREKELNTLRLKVNLGCDKDLTVAELLACSV
jgi:hypothetical protein